MYSIKHFKIWNLTAALTLFERINLNKLNIEQCKRCMVGQIGFLPKINHVNLWTYVGHHPTMIKIALKKVSSKDRKLLLNAVAIIFPRK